MSVLLEGNGGRDPRVLVKCFVRCLLLGRSCHLHSTDTPEFCEEDDDDEDETGGSAKVSMTAAVNELEDGDEDDEDDDEAATVPAEHSRREQTQCLG